MVGSGLHFSSMASPAGPLLILAGEHGLARISFRSEPDGYLETALSKHYKDLTLTENKNNEHIELTVSQLSEYFAGDRSEFSIALDLRGTPFQIRVWKKLLNVPFGKTRSYGEIANELDSCARAVGSANGQNPIPIIVPCHRVIASNGKLQGFRGGLDIKAKLLELEGVFPLHHSDSPTLF